MRLFTMILLLAAAVYARADSAWTTHIEGNGTPFEKRWAIADPLTEESSAGTMLAIAGINVDEGELELYVVHPYPVADALVSALAGEELDCKYDSWRLAVDRKEFKIADTSESTDNAATFLHPKEVKAFWQAFAAGSLLAVQVERTCDGDMNVATMVYSLAGSQAAVDFVLNKVPVPARESQEGDAALRPPASQELAAYQFAISQKIRRNWAVPASATEDTECVVRVRQTRTGDVISAYIVSCNGDEAVRRSIEAAVMRASPLPEPSNPDLFQAELRIILRPDLQEEKPEADVDVLPIVRVAPVYPAEALSRDLEGYVDLSFTVTTAGAVRDPFVIYSTNELFDSAAIRAVLKYKYMPPSVDVEGVTTRILFSLGD